MRKFIVSAFIILIIPFFLPLIVKAETYNYTKEEIQNAVNNYFNSSFNFTDASISTFNNMANDSNYDNYYFYMVSYGNTEMNFIIYPSRASSSGTNWSVGSPNYYISNLQTSTGIRSMQTNRQFPKANTKEFTSKEELLEFFAPAIDFDTLYYSAQIPLPTIDVYMDNSVDYPTAGQAIWNATIEIGDNSQYYVQWGYKISWPTYIDLGLSGVQGDITYNYYGYLSSPFVDIVTMNSLTEAVAQGATASTFQPMWESFYNGLTSELALPEFSSNINAMSQSMINNAKQYYIDYMMTQIPMYGNRLEIFARYFIVDSENNNRVVVGAWNHWSSKDGSRTKERPSNYIDNVALPGYISSNDDTTYQDNQDTYSSNGETTGTAATIINNNYAPNYPDYPTVATYNHDNILLNFMDTARQLPSFFGEFTGFLTVAFGFIPSWIWAIVGAGFTFSIVIMIIKVL